MGKIFEKESGCLCLTKFFVFAIWIGQGVLASAMDESFPPPYPLPPAYSADEPPAYPQSLQEEQASSRGPQKKLELTSELQESERSSPSVVLVNSLSSMPGVLTLSVTGPVSLASGRAPQGASESGLLGDVREAYKKNAWFDQEKEGLSTAPVGSVHLTKREIEEIYEQIQKLFRVEHMTSKGLFSFQQKKKKIYASLYQQEEKSLENLAALALTEPASYQRVQKDLYGLLLSLFRHFEKQCQIKDDHNKEVRICFLNQAAILDFIDAWREQDKIYGVFQVPSVPFLGISADLSWKEFSKKSQEEFLQKKRSLDLFAQQVLQQLKSPIFTFFLSPENRSVYQGPRKKFAHPMKRYLDLEEFLIPSFFEGVSKSPVSTSPSTLAAPVEAGGKEKRPSFIWELLHPKSPRQSQKKGEGASEVYEATKSGTTSPASSPSSSSLRSQTSSSSSSSSREAARSTIDSEVEPTSGHELFLLGEKYEKGIGGCRKNDERAVYYYQKAAAVGDRDGLCRLAFFHLHGRGGFPQSPSKAIELIRPHVLTEYPAALDLMAFCYQHGLSIEKNPNEAVRLYRLAEAARVLSTSPSDNGLAKAKLLEERRRKEEQEVEKLQQEERRQQEDRWRQQEKRREAERQTQAEDKRREVERQHQQQQIWQEERDRQEEERRLEAERKRKERLQREAEERRREAERQRQEERRQEAERQRQEEKRREVEKQRQEEEKRRQIERKQEAARRREEERRRKEEEDPEVCYLLAKKHHNGESGYEKNLKEAARYYRLAADLGHAESQHQLGDFYASGKGGLLRDLEEAASLYQQSADQGNAGAQYHLGLFYLQGRGGLEKEVDLGINFLKLAGQQGQSQALMKLGSLYEQGLEVERDVSLALTCYQVALRLGLQEAQEKVDQLQSQQREQERQRQRNEERNRAQRAASPPRFVGILPLLPPSPGILRQMQRGDEEESDPEKDDGDEEEENFFGWS